MNFEANFGFDNKKNNAESRTEVVKILKNWEDPDLPEEFEAEKKTVEFEGAENIKDGPSYLMFKDFGHIPRSKVPDFEKVRSGDKFEVFTKLDKIGNNPVADIVMVKNLSTGNKMTTADWKDSL